MNTHDLKTDPFYFEQVWKGNKKSELRKNDRKFKADDNVILKEFDRLKKEYSGREIKCSISYVTNYPDALKEGYVMLCLRIGELSESFL